jgi:hypothetical protein
MNAIDNAQSNYYCCDFTTYRSRISRLVATTGRTLGALRALRDVNSNDYDIHILLGYRFP